MKILYTLAFVLFSATVFAQAPAIADEPATTNKSAIKSGLYVELSYGYNTRSVMPDFAMLSGTPGIYKPHSYLSGHLPSIEVGYTFNSRLSVHASFSKPIPLKHSFSDKFMHGFTQAKGWYASAGFQLFPFSQKKINPYIKADFNVGSFSIQNFQSYQWPQSNNGYISRGGYALGGSLAIGAQIQVCRRGFLSAEASFIQMAYKPKEQYYLGTDVTKPYTLDQSDTVDPNYGYVYVPTNPLQQYISMSAISFRAGFRYYVFTR